MQEESKSSAMFDLVQEFQQSGKSQKQFSGEKRIRLHTFGYWVKKYNQSQGAHPGFASLTVGNEPRTQSAQPRMEIEFADGAVVRIY
jgi:hypothetical protein